jgi:uncharacterized membrane protein YgdD (TMEM256/DUF423 family)
MERVLLAGAGLAGFAGVAIGAAASHLAAGNVATHDLLDIASRYLLLHALASLGAGILLLLEISPRARTFARIAGGLFLAGVTLFSGGITLHAVAGHPVVDMIIPLGGIALMLGWLALAASGVGLARRRRA